MKQMIIKNCILIVALCLAPILQGCEMAALQRGILNQAYISTARPSITLQAKNMPYMTGGQGMAALEWSSMLGGLTVDVWLAVYGEGGLAPLAVTAQAQVPTGWHWDGIMSQPFSVDESVEVFNGVGYQACTFIIDNPEKSPFGSLVTSVKSDGTPQRWIARYFATRYNFDSDKVILEYLEPLPDDITSLTAIPYGRSDFLSAFEQRARDAFVVGPGPANPTGVDTGYANNIQWQYMGQRFLGSASENIRFGYFD